MASFKKFEKALKIDMKTGLFNFEETVNTLDIRNKAKR